MDAIPIARVDHRYCDRCIHSEGDACEVEIQEWKANLLVDETHIYCGCFSEPHH